MKTPHIARFAPADAKTERRFNPFPFFLQFFSTIARESLSPHNRDCYGWACSNSPLANGRGYEERIPRNFRNIEYSMSYFRRTETAPNTRLRFEPKVLIVRS